MRAYAAFVKKEFLEMSRTYKLLIMGIIFGVLGLMNPLTAKFTPELLAALMPAGMTIELGEPSVMDSWMQFFKNIPQMGLIVAAVLFGGILGNEISKGTLINLLTKGLSRNTVVLAKFTAWGIMWTCSYALSFIITLLYTNYYWEDSADSVLLAGAVSGVWIFGLLLIAAALLGGSLFASMYGSLLFMGGIVVIQFLLGIIPDLGRWMPTGLISNNMSLLEGKMDMAGFMRPLLTAVLLTALFLWLSCAVFRKKQL